MFLFFAIFWALIFGAIGYSIGNRKGAGSDGLFWGVLLGPIGLLIAVLLRGNRLACPSCKEPVHPEATKCPHCAADIVRPKVPQVSCPKCSWYYDADKTGCPHCGAAKPRTAA